MTQGPISRVAAPLRSQVTAAIRAAIVESDFQPGDRLIEAQLCSKYDVSRTVVREALRQLETEGLVTMVPNRGPEVARLSIHEAECLYEVRGSLESLAGSLFARRASDSDCTDLVNAFNSVKRAMALESPHELLAAKDRYYEVLLSGARNEEAAQMLKMINARTQILRGYSLSAEGRSTHTIEELTAITTATAIERDPDAAAAACALHVANAAEAALAEMRRRL